MTYEDFTDGWTEVEEQDDIQKTANHVDFYFTLDRTTYFYKSYGLDRFGDFTHHIDAKIIDMNDGHLGYFYVLSQDLGDWYYLYTDAHTAIGVRFQRGGDGTYYVFLTECHGDLQYTDIYAGISAGTMYYFEIVKSGTSLTCKIYSDSDRTDLIDTLSLTLQANHKFEYAMACSSYDNGSSGYAGNLDVENLDLKEAVGLSIPVAMHHYRSLRES